MKVECEIYETEIENERGKSIPSVRAECEECGHTTESYGRGAASIKRCLVMLRQECPERQENYYVEF